MVVLTCIFFTVDVVKDEAAIRALVLTDNSHPIATDTLPSERLLALSQLMTARTSDPAELLKQPLPAEDTEAYESVMLGWHKAVGDPAKQLIRCFRLSVYLRSMLVKVSAQI